MMMKRYMALTVCSLALAGLMAACTKKDEKPELADTKSTVIKDLPGDVGNTVSSGKPFEPFYFSLEQGLKVDGSKVKTADWDIAFTEQYNSLIVINNGLHEGTPGFDGAARGKILIVEQPYAEVSQAPADADFETKGIPSFGWDSGNGIGWFFYDLKTHIAVPVKNRTFVLRTASGKFAKLEMVSMYKGAPATVSDLNWPAPYFTFRYYVQADGSRDLSTK
ncbi:HmuY family protein [Pedobacter faecalis]|uniref:HmuY family protein n=1 Tax=Pedobacter faecalis TaxID=3041495 RepID=UPI00254C64A6|nr:HmuY family protein [Pedobacter sp. ELA7]